jgi:uncharacterized SAM-binding protein YcdF (DUF218 family)
MTQSTRFRIHRRAEARRRGPWHAKRRGLTVLVAVIMAFGLVTGRLFVWPAQGMSASVSAIVMLAGPGNRLPVALQLARERRAPVLVVSRGWRGYGGPCPSPIPGMKLICFDPDPGNTRGEAEALGRLAKQFRWSSVVLVTTRTQDTRARMMVERCFGGSIYVVTAPMPMRSWPYQIAYGWGALLKALIVYRAC